MIADYSSYLELLAAVYVSMLLDVEALSKLWYPDNYYEKIETALNEEFSKEFGVDNLKEKILSASKHNASTRNTRMRCRALFMLSLTAIMLALLGYESSFDDNMILHEHWYNAVLISCFLGVALCFFGGGFFDNWNTTALGILLVVLCLIVLMLVSIEFPDYSGLANYYPVTIVVLLTLPVLWEIFSRWLFSSVYSGYLRSYVVKVKNDYSKAIQALRANDKRHVPTMYKKLIDESIYTSNNNMTLSDICIQGYIDIRDKKLCEISRYPNGFVLFFSWLGFCFYRLYKYLKNRCLSRPMSVTKTHRPVSLYVQPVVVNTQDVILNYQKEYDEFMVEKSKKNGKLSVKEFCQQHGYDADAMVTWLKQRKKK